MKKLYVVVTEWQKNAEGMLDINLVTESKIKAVLKFNELVKAERKIWKKGDYNVSKTEGSFEAFEEGYYALNHCTIKIHEKSLCA